MPSSNPKPFFQWSLVGVMGVLLLFVLAVHVPDSMKVPGLFPIGLAAVAGWGLGRWALVQRVSPTLWIPVVAGLSIAAGEVLSAVKTSHDRAAYLKALPKWQETADDPVTEKLREFLTQEPPDETEEARRKRLEALNDLERGEQFRRERLKRLTFYGFLDDRLRSRGIDWPAPWPAILWGAEVLAAAGIGGWLALRILRSGTPKNPE